MKKIFALLCFLPFFSQAQQLEAGANFGNATTGSLAIRFNGCLKAGIGYEMANFTAVTIPGDGHINVKMGMPFLFIDQYKHVRKHEFYYGLDAGKIYLRNKTDFAYYQDENGFEIGAHAGYSLQIIGPLYANAQVGFQYYRCTVNARNTSATTDGFFVPLSIGAHLILF